MNDLPLSPTHCTACEHEAKGGIAAAYDGVPFARLCAACVPQVGARYRFLGAVFSAFPHDDGLLSLAIIPGTPFPTAAMRLLESSLREVTEARGMRGVAH